MLNQSAELDLIYSALADPTRRAIITRLTGGYASVSDIAKPLKMSLPAVVQHLNLLEASGFVVSKKNGRVRTCRIEPKRLETAQAWLVQQRAFWEGRLDRMDAFLLKNTNDKK